MTHSAQSAKPDLCTVIDFGASNACHKQAATRALVARELQIMAAAQAGSAAAFDELQRRYTARLFKTILCITKNREDAEDALQDTFLRAYMALHRFQGRSSVYSWLTRIAINSALMILRRRRSHPETLFSSTSEDGDSNLPLEVRDTSYNPEQLCDLSQRRSHLLQAIEKLEPRLRAPIEIQLNGTDAMKDIADRLNISVAAVKARLYRARIRLAKRVSVFSGARNDTHFGMADRSAYASPQADEEQYTTCR